MTDTQPEYAVIDGGLVQLAFVAPDGTEVPQVHLQSDDGLTICGTVFRARWIASTTTPTDVTCSACNAAAG